MDSILQDGRYALRMLRRNPAFAVVAVLALALGIGANTAIFSVIDAVLLHPLPYPEADRLVSLSEASPGQGLEGTDVSWLNFRDWQRESRSFDGLGAWAKTGLTLTGVEEPAEIVGAWISEDLLALTGGEPLLGRAFTAEEQQRGAAPAVLISDGLWRGRLGGDPDALGRTLTLNAGSATVIGVMPPGFRFPSPEVEVWTPLESITGEPWMQDRDVHVLGVIGRLRPGATLETARDEMGRIMAGVLEDHPGEDDGHTARVAPLIDEIVGDARTPLLILLVAVGFVLLIACANVANLLLARGAARSRELAVRAVLGATRGRTVRQLLTESLLLSLIGGTVGLLLAAWGIDLLTARFVPMVPRAEGIGLDGGVLAFTVGLSLLTGLTFGLFPSVQDGRVPLRVRLTGRGDTAAGAAPRGIRQGLMVAEVALSVVLLVGTGLLLRSLWTVMQQPPGFEPESLLLMTISLPAADFPDTGDVVAFYRGLPGRLESLPGVRSASAVNRPPLGGGDSTGALTIEGRPFPPGEAPGASFRRVLPNYFRTMGIPLTHGREFDAHDDGSRHVVLINETMARRLWGDTDPVGTRIKVGPAEREPWLTIVGVVGDVRNQSLERGPEMATYEPHAQRPWRTMRLAIRTETAPGPLAPTIRRLLREQEPRLLISGITTMRDQIASTLAPRRLNLVLLGLFAGLALVLTCVGLYGVMSYSVARRTREIGLRAALGARRWTLLWMILGSGLRVTLLGTAVGLGAALGLTRLMTALLYGVTATDARTFLLVPVPLLAVALLASYLPARRAARLDPMVALRED